MKRKAAGKTIEPPVEGEDRGNVIDLMEALRQSVKTKGSKVAPLRSNSGSKKRAPARKRRSKIARSRKSKAA